MLTTLLKLFDQHGTVQPDNTEASRAQRTHIAAAVLLVEVARSDQSFSDSERRAILEAVQRNFQMSSTEAQELLELAELESRNAYDLYQFTSKIDKTFPPAHKAQLIEELWRAAYSDTVLHAHEEHLIRRVADLLHLSHSQFIAAKLRALATAPPSST